jgi:DNA-binding response OmpR family regulator
VPVTGPHILIVEDEQLIREVLEAVLQDCGFAATSVGTADQAIATLEVFGAKCSVLITDINLGLPSLTGWDVARRGRELNSALPVVYITGADAADRAAKGVSGSILLAKPFAPIDLVAAVQVLLAVSPERHQREAK